MLTQYIKYIEHDQSYPESNTDKDVQDIDRVKINPKTDAQGSSAIFNNKGTGYESKGGGDGDSKKESDGKR